MSMHGYGSVIRRMAAAGRTSEEIADLYGFDPAAVAALVGTPVGEAWRLQPRKTPTDRPILAQTATRVRELVDQGWSAARIARELDLDPARVREFVRRIEPDRGGRLVIPRTRPEQARLERNRRKARARGWHGRKRRRPGGSTNGRRPPRKTTGSAIRRPRPSRRRRRSRFRNSSPSAWSRISIRRRARNRRPPRGG